jgi:hypothetical protein
VLGKVLFTAGMRVGVLVVLFFCFVGYAGNPVEIDLPAERATSNIVRDVTVHLLEGISSSTVGEPATYAPNEIEIQENDLPVSLYKELSAAKPIPASSVFSLFKKTSKDSAAAHYQLRSREKFHAKEIPDTLADFERLDPFPGTGFTKTVMKHSRVKNAARIIYRRRSGGLSIAQTFDSAGAVRETEIIKKRSHSENWDFYVYDHTGDLTLQSTFSTVAEKPRDISAPVPITCLNCHYDAKARVFENTPHVHP